MLTNSFLQNRFDTISLDQISEVALQKRVDTKFVTSTEKLKELMECLNGAYQLLSVNGDSLISYETVYYDTDDLRFYKSHHTQRRNRYKLRCRKYVNNNLIFLEIKHKTNKGITLKNRVHVEEFTSVNSQLDFIKNHIPNSGNFSKKLINSFDRFTLVDLKTKERLTVDQNLSFDGISWKPELAVIELKQSKFNRFSNVFRHLSRLKVKQSSFSKYCIGLCLKHPELKQNNFKPILRAINQNF